jgi:hypothetical protein
MFFPILTAALASAASARSVRPPIFAQEPILNQPVNDEGYRIPTVHESLVLARRILHLTTIGTLVSTFPSPSSSLPSDFSQQHVNVQEYTAYENRPAEVAGSPVGLMEYYADCEPYTGNPTLLAIDIATPYRNYAAGSNISLHVRWWPTQKNTYLPYLDLATDAHDEDPTEIPTPHTPAALPRFSLHGYLEPIPAEDLASRLIPACFMHAHPDSALWQPGNDIHTSHYVRLVVEHVYWFGGFGDRARIGWLPIEEWRNVTMHEVAQARLPGESRGRRHEPAQLEEEAEAREEKRRMERGSTG